MRFFLSVLLLLPFKTIADEPSLDFRSVECLARNMYYEARGEGALGLQAVGHVTMNRVRATGYPNTVCEVVQQKIQRQCQFSWVCKRKLPHIKSERYGEVLALARKIYTGVTTDPTRGATSFHAKTVSPGWKLRRTVVIGNHIFYRK